MKKEKFKRNRVDRSKIEGRNPTYLLQEAREEMMKIESVEAFKTRMTEIIDSSQISRKNYLKYERNRDGIETLEEMQVYFFNYILAGSGLQTKFER